MMDGKVSGLGVVVSPWCEVIVSLAGAAVNLDLNATHGLRKENNASDRESRISQGDLFYGREKPWREKIGD